MLTKPSYILADFIKACGLGENHVFISEKARITAKADFNLNTQKQILDFIANGGIESPNLQNVKLWENNPDPDNPIWADAYDFFSGFQFGYIAFSFRPKIKKWNIKSFKNNIKSDPRNLPFNNSVLKEFKKKLLGV